MPRNGSGVYSKPAGTTAVTNTAIESAKYNSTIDDLVTDANTARPIVAGGTGQTSLAGIKSAFGIDGKEAISVYTTKAGAYTALADDNNGLIRFSVAATLSLTAAATLGLSWHAEIFATGGVVTIDPNGAETINGASTFAVPNGTSVVVVCTGTAFFTTTKPSTAKTANTLVARDSLGAIYGQDFNADRGDGSGAYFFGGGTTRYVQWDNTYYQFGGAIRVVVNGDGLYIGGTASGSLYQSDGNINFTAGMLSAYGATLDIALNSLNATKATVYTGTGAGDTILPIGHTIMVNSVTPNRNAGLSVWINSGNNTQYVGSASGAQLAGTYRGRGNDNASACLAERTA
jgi:hypothetical protein